MNVINDFFQNKTDRYLRIDKYFDPMYSPEALLKFLKSSSELKYLKKLINSKTTNIFKIFKRLSLASILLIHSNKFYDFLSDLCPMESGNKWIDEEFVQPYCRFIKKICCSFEMYDQMKRHMPLNGDRNMEMLFYNISLLKMVFVIVAKMPLLGRYYKDQNQMVTCNFINTLAVHAQKIYVSLRVILVHVIENSKLYLPTREHELVMKGVLCDELPMINEEMKKLFLDKYFYPLGKGIGLKLFKPEQQAAQTSKTIKGIISDHEDTRRRQQKYQLQVTLFPAPGRVNMQFYEQSLFASIQHIEEKGYEQEVADIDIDEDFQVRKTQKMNESDAETGVEREVKSLKEI